MKILSLVSLACAFQTFNTVSGIPVGSELLGATYFITNKAANTIIVSSIGGDGKLSFAKEVATGGAGGSASGGADALFTQDCIVQSHGMLFAVNPGDNTLSFFTIDASDPTNLIMVGKPANTMGQFPVAVTFSHKLHTTCVLNGGGDTNVVCFRVSKKKGLIPLPNTVRSLGQQQSVPPTGPANTVSDILFNQDQSQLLASVKGSPNGTAGFIANFAVTRHPFSLASQPVKSTPNKGVLPFSMTLVGKSGDVVLNTDAGFGISVSRFDCKTGAINSSSSVVIQNQTATCWSSTSPRTGSFYTTDVGNALVQEFSVDPSVPEAKLIGTHPLEGIGGRIDQIVGSTKAGDFLYILAAKAGAVDVLKLDGPGKAEQIQSFNVTAVVPDLPISVQGMAVYVK